LGPSKKTLSTTGVPSWLRACRQDILSDRNYSFHYRDGHKTRFSCSGS